MLTSLVAGTPTATTTTPQHPPDAAKPSGEGSVERTSDGRFIVVNGRRWRATDPLIPDDRQAELRSALMAWWREKRAARAEGDDGRVRRAQQGVQAVKVALGERGTPWWEQDEAQRQVRWSAPVSLP